MKLVAGMLASSVLAVSLMAGCAMNPNDSHAAAPAIKVSASAHNIDQGTSARVTAESVNLVGAGDVRWTVSPNVGHINVDSSHGQTAVFSADQPGTYLIKASVDAGNGHWISDATHITVNGVTDINGRPVGNKDAKGYDNDNDNNHMHNNNNNNDSANNR